jgi:large subunit ribosomal protein L22
MKRFRPRARGRASRIRKRSCHITIIVARMDDERLARARATRTTDGAARSRRVAGSRRRADQQSHAHRREVAREEAAEVAAEEAVAQEAVDTAIDHEHDPSTELEAHDGVEGADDGDGAGGEGDESDASEAATAADAGEDEAGAAGSGDADASEEHTD